MIESVDEFIKLRLSESKEEYDRSTSEDASLETWHELISNHPEMREWVAQNKTVPVEILELLCSDQNVQVRCVVATKRKLSKELQLKLAQDSDESVRNRLVYNAKACKEALELLSNDTFEPTKSKAIERLENREYR